MQQSARWDWAALTRRRPARRAPIGDRLLGLVQIAKDPPGSAKIGGAFRGQDKGPRRAQQQAHAEPRLNPARPPG